MSIDEDVNFTTVAITVIKIDGIPLDVSVLKPCEACAETIPRVLRLQCEEENTKVCVDKSNEDFNLIFLIT